MDDEKAIRKRTEKPGGRPVTCDKETCKRRNASGKQLRPLQQGRFLATRASCSRCPTAARSCRMRAPLEHGHRGISIRRHAREDPTPGCAP